MKPFPPLFYPTINFPSKMPVITKKHPKRETTPAQRTTVVTLHKQKIRNSEIMKQTGLPRSTMRSIIKRYASQVNLTYKGLPKPGRPRKLDACAERRLLRHANI